MTGPNAEGGPLPPANPERLAQHERRLALAFPPDGTIRVLSAVQDGDTWHVDLDIAPVDEETRVPTDPAAVRLHIETDAGSSSNDLPVEVLRRIAKRIREL